MTITRRLLLKLAPLIFWRSSPSLVIGAESEAALPFGPNFPTLDSLAIGEWWKAASPTMAKTAPPPSMNVARDEVVAFAPYTHDHGVLKLTAQFFPLMPGEERIARLEFQREGAILEDRKFKSGPFGKIPEMGPRPDHINDPDYDPGDVDLPGLQLLGERQEKFLRDWGQDWTGADMKVVLSATSFCGAVHMHGKDDNRLLADLDCNGWPQTPRNRALEEIRRAWAVHLCGDQHLAVVTKQGIDEYGDGPYSFTSPALVNTTYGRWWHPLDEQPGPHSVADSPLPWTGDFKDGFGNRLSMMAYANPPDINDERQRADGYGNVRFDKQSRQITFECWPRFFDVQDGGKAQFPGWPITISMESNDGRKVAGWLPELVFENRANPVVQVIEEATGEVLYTVRTQNGRFSPRVYSTGKHSIKLGPDKPDAQTFAGLEPIPKAESGQRVIIKIEQP